jgi:hypothetical protein
VKTCTGCNVEKELTEFHKDKHSSDGFTYRCKICRAKAKDRYLSENRSKANAYAREYHWKNRQGILARKAAWRAVPCNQEAGREYVKAYLKTPVGKETARRNIAKRKATKRHLPSEPYSRCEITLRDAGESWATGAQVVAADTTAVEVDHLIPLAYYIPGHPGDVLANVALCESSLNRSRRDKLTSEALRQYTRNVVLDVPDVSHLGNVLEF